MLKPRVRTSLLALSATILFPACVPDAGARSIADSLPIAVDNAPLATPPGLDTAYLAGGCFWGVEAVFEHVRGVVDVVAGYAGGRTNSPSYEAVSAGATGHAESVRVIYDPAVVPYGELLRVFFAVAHDPTRLNRQGPDIGTQYRSAIYYRTADQRRIAESYISQLTEAKVFNSSIVTEVAAMDRFFEAEAYHQDFAAKHPLHPYIVVHDAPKVARLKSEFVALYRER